MSKKGLSDIMRWFFIAVVVIILLFVMVMCATLGGMPKGMGGG
jgi:uncharacterized membrane protein YhdT